MEKRKHNDMRILADIIVLVVSSIPLAWGFVVGSGDIHIWLARIEEVKNSLLDGQFCLFPSAELTLGYNGQFSALNSNLWLVLPAMLRIVGISVASTYRIYMLILNVITLVAAEKFFKNLVQDKVAGFVGVLLYMTCPYRIYLCYDKAALGMVAAYALFPLVIDKLCKKEKRTWKEWVVGAVSLALVGYGDGMIMFITAGILVCGVFWYRNWKNILLLIQGSILFLPGLIYWARYLIKGGMEMYDLPLLTISAKGYEFGQFFSSWVYEKGVPGLGLGILSALIGVIWLRFIEKDIFVDETNLGFFVIALCGFMAMSLRSFPWDVLQRIGEPSLRLVGMIETPAIFAGVGSFAACVVGAYGIKGMLQQKQVFIRIGIPIMIGIGALGIAAYLCNMLVFHSVSLIL